MKKLTPHTGTKTLSAHDVIKPCHEETHTPHGDENTIHGIEMILRNEETHTPHGDENVSMLLLYVMTYEETHTPHGDEND